MKILQILCCLCLCFNAAAQKSKTVTVTTPESTEERLTGLRTGLFLDSGLHPGLKFGKSYILKEKEKSRKHLFKFKQNKHGNKVKTVQYLLDGNAGFYNHPNNHFGTFVGVGLTRFRLRERTGITYGFSFELSYLRRFYNNKTYELTDNGTIRRVPLAGTNNVVFALSPSFGKIMGTKKGKEGWHLYFKPSLQILTYNHSFVPNATLEIGVTVNMTK